MPSLPLLAGKMKIASSVGVAGVSVISVPTTLAMVGGSKSLIEPLKGGIEQVKNWASESTSGLDGNLTSEYSQFGTNVESVYNDHLTENLKVLKEGIPKAKGYKDLLKENGEEINYYLFTLGTLVKEVIKNVPIIVKDSILAALPGSENQHLLSVQKMVLIGQSEKLSDFLEGIKQTLQQHSSLISELSSKDAKGIVQIFKELGAGNINTFLKEVKTNSSNLESESSKYCSPTKLMLHLLVGKDKIEKITNQINELKTTLESMKDKIEKIPGLNDTVNKVTQQLGQLSNNPAIKDPCPSTSQ